MDFEERKAAAMAMLSSSSPDKSPKGSLDAPIAPLVAALNRRPSLFTTSSCSGRITLLSHPSTHSRKKAGGGHWLLASHDPADPDAVAALLFGPAASVPPEGLLVFRFEPLIIAIECRDAETAQWLVSKAISCGFRESGITNLGRRIMAAVRCSIRMEVPLGDSNKLMVTPEYVRYLTRVANEKMEANKGRTEGFYQALLQEELAKPMVREGSICLKPRKKDMLAIPYLTDSTWRNKDNTTVSDALDVHDAMSVVAMGKDERLYVSANCITPESRECRDKENKEKDSCSGFDKWESVKLVAKNIEIKGKSVESLFLWGHSACVSNYSNQTCITIFGGFGGTGRHARRNDILLLEPKSGLLSVVDAEGSPSPRLGHTSSIIADQFFVIGGRCGPTETRDDVWLLDMVDLRWRLLDCRGSIFHPRHRHAAAVVGTHIYVFGGLNNDVVYSCMHVLDTKALHWTELSGDGERPCARHSHSLVAYGSQLFLFGGYDGERALGDLYSFDVETQVWKKEEYVGRGPIPRFSHCCFIYKNYLGIVGGCPLRQEHQDITLLDLTNRVWKHIKIDYMSKFFWIRSSAHIVADDLVIIGGGAACYAFGTKFSCPMKLCLLDVGAEDYHGGKGDHGMGISNGTSDSNTTTVSGLTDTECTVMKKLPSHKLEVVSHTDCVIDLGILEPNARSHVEPMFFMLQVEKKFAKIGKDILKWFGWLDIGRKVVSNEDGSQICLPVTCVFNESWRSHLVNTSEEMHADYLSESHLSKGFKVNNISIPQAFNLLLACGGFMINDDQPKIRKASKPPRKVLQDAVSSLIAKKGLPQHLLHELPTRWEHLGDIVVLPVSAFRDPLWDSIAEDLWPTVAKSLNARRLARQGRILPTGTRDSTLQILVGDTGLVTHQENDITYFFDATKCMFSAGNVSEKLRMSRLDCRNEIVVDLFAGIGYFVLPFLVKSKAKLVYACEWNHHALEALKHNIQINGVANRCIVLEGDNHTTAPRQVADRVCLGLLPSSECSWVTAVRALKKEGGVLHIHGNVNDLDELPWSEHVVESIDSIAKSEGCYWDVTIEHLERVKWYGPHIRHVVADVRCKQLC